MGESGDDDDELPERDTANLRALQRISNLPSSGPVAATLADDFEREMEAELDGRMRASEDTGVQAVRVPVSQTPAADASKTEYYDDAYFDTDEEGDDDKGSAPAPPQGSPHRSMIRADCGRGRAEGEEGKAGGGVERRPAVRPRHGCRRRAVGARAAGWARRFACILIPARDVSSAAEGRQRCDPQLPGVPLRAVHRLPAVWRAHIPLSV